MAKHRPSRITTTLSFRLPNEMAQATVTRQLEVGPVCRKAILKALSKRCTEREMASFEKQLGEMILREQTR